MAGKKTVDSVAWGSDFELATGLRSVALLGGELGVTRGMLGAWAVFNTMGLTWAVMKY